MSNRSIRLLRVPVTLAAPLALGACSLLGFGSAGQLPDMMPRDFRFVHTVQDATQPPIDYTLAFDRSGLVSYDVNVRAPRRSQNSGTFEVSEDALQGIYSALLVADFDQLPERMDAEVGSERRDVGDRAYFVRADGYEKRVEARFTDTPELAMIRKQMLKEVPEDVFDPPGTATETPTRLVAEDANRLFHRGECKVLAQAGSAGRRDFDTHFDALNFGYDPCEACNPTGGGGR